MVRPPFKMKKPRVILTIMAAMMIVMAAVAMAPAQQRKQKKTATQKENVEAAAETADFMSLLGGVAEEMTADASIDYILGTVDYNGWRDTYQKTKTGPGALNIKGFLRPVPGMVTSNFGFRPQYGRMHHGIDLALHEGDTVRAALTGVVEKIGYDFNGYGHYVMLRHAQGVETLYGHLHHPIVRKGDIVGMGMPIAIGGNTGRSTGPHLHLEIRMNGIAVDPRLVYGF